jgi:hypothetical protein
MATVAAADSAGSWPDRLRLPLAFDAGRMAAEVALLDPDAWIRHFVRANYEGEWSVLPLRAPAGATHPLQTIFAGPCDDGYVDTPWLARVPYIGSVLASFRCPANAVRLMRLGRGSTIREHSDPDLSAEDGLVRLHIPVSTNPDVDFRLAGVRVSMEPGSVWYLRLAEPHSVHNRGATDRDHLVIDCVLNDWLAGLLSVGA